MMEGVSNEAASIAGTLGLGKLVYFYDDNHITIDGTTSISFTEDRGKRLEAQGWHVQHVTDANDLDALREAIANAKATVALRDSTPRHELVWSFAPAAALVPRRGEPWHSTTPESVALSKELRRRGFRFVGPTTAYAAMQACGVVNDHLAQCWVRASVESERMVALAT